MNIPKTFKSISILISVYIIFFTLHQCKIATQNNQTKELMISYLLLTKTEPTKCLWVRDLTKTNQDSYCVNADLVASTASADFYLESGLKTSLNISTIAKSFEEQIQPKITNTFGKPSDINKDGKITIVVLDIKDGYKGSGGFVAGFVDPINFYPDDSRYRVRSNEKEILYLDGVQLASLGQTEFLSTLAHEYQHLIRYPYAQGYDPDWIDEGSSEVASDIALFGTCDINGNCYQESRIRCFRGDTSRSSCTLGGAYHSIFSWEGRLENYAYSYSLMKYFYENSGNTIAERNQFLQCTVQGCNGKRADSTTNLMEIFKAKSTKYNSTYLTENSTTMFQRLLASFFGQALGYTDFTKVYFGVTSTAFDLTNVKNVYPIPNYMRAQYISSQYPSTSSNSNGYNLYPSTIRRINSSTTGITTGDTDSIAIGGTNEFILINGQISTPYTTQETTKAEIVTKLKESPQEEKICIHKLLNQSEEVKLKKLQFKKVSPIIKDKK